MAAAPESHRYDQLLEALPDGVVVTTPGGRILAVNEQLCTLSGFDRDALVGGPVEYLIPARFRAEHVAQRTAYVDDGGGMRAMSDRRDIVLLRADHREVPVDVALSTSGTGVDRVVVATVRDASARRGAELAREREHRFLTAMNDITVALFSDGDVDQTLRTITRRARELLESDLALLALPDIEADRLRFQIVDGYAADELEGETVPAATSMAGTVMREREPTLVTDASNDPRVHRPPSWPRDLGPALFVPLHARNETLGSLTIANRQGGAMFRAADVALMKAFAAQGTVALLDARNQSHQRRVEILEERDRVAAAMHDSVIKRISSASMTLHTVLEGTLPEGATTRLWGAIDELDTAISSIRDAVFPH